MHQYISIQYSSYSYAHKDRLAIEFGKVNNSIIAPHVGGRSQQLRPSLF